MTASRDRLRLVVGLLIGLLAVPQAVALAVQFARGFRPFRAATTRVPFSWDMFSVRIERCGVRWDPPLRGSARSVAALREVAAPFEWEPIYDQVAQYRRTATRGCPRTDPKAHITLDCVLPDGRSLHDEFDCP